VCKPGIPIQEELVKRLEIEELDIKVAAVCVYHTLWKRRCERLRAAAYAWPLSPLDFRLGSLHC